MGSESHYSVPADVDSLAIVFVDDRFIKNLNLIFRGNNKTTDVLSFCELENRSGPIVSAHLGDIVISLETAGRQAQRAGCSLNREIERLIIHGILHLFGYEHEGVLRPVAQRMRGMESMLRRVIV